MQGIVSPPGVFLVHQRPLAECWILGWGRGGGCSDLPVGRRGAICGEPGKMENRLIFLCRDLARAGVLGGKLAFTTTRTFLKRKDCCGEENLL